MNDVGSIAAEKSKRPVVRAFGRAKYGAAQAARVAWYAAHYGLARRRSAPFNRPGEPPFQPKSPPPSVGALRKAFLDLFRRDRANVEAGLYPAPEDLRLRDLSRALKSSSLMTQDLEEVDARRLARNGVEAREIDGAERFPVYYRQNFHYQTGGWLTDESARIYDSQVELLFTGAGDAMRRSALAEISRELRARKTSRTATYVDVGCGTGRFLAQTLAAYPRLDAYGLELSPAYCSRARRSVRAWPKAQILEGAAEALPMEDESADILCSVYLFHELPPKIRRAAAAEFVRVVKPGGLFVFTDSLQLGDAPDLDRMLEYFPEGFHEPYYKSYLTEDFDHVLGEAGFVPERRQLAFLTKTTTWRKPAGV